MYQIRNTSQKILEKMLGMNYQEIMDMDYEEGNFLYPEEKL